MSRSRLAVDYPFCENSFIRRRGLHDFSTRNVFIRTLFYLEINNNNNNNNNQDNVYGAVIMT